MSPSWLAAAAIAALAIGTVVGLARLARASGDEWSDEEYERRRKAGGEGLLAASMKVLGEELVPGGRGAAEAREVIEQGRVDESARSGDGAVPSEGRRSGSPAASPAGDPAADHPAT